jgi:hypothetical protein
MEPTVEAGHDDMRGLRLDILRTAAEIYLCLAYSAAVIPVAVTRRLVWREEGPADKVLGAPPFERAGKGEGRAATVFALRLGNHRYPHMKLQIQPWPNSAGFMLSVNSHDQVSGLGLGADAHAFRDLQAENQRLKEAIEQAWDDAGLPTFLRYLRDYINSRAGLAPGPETSGSSGCTEMTDPSDTPHPV